MKNDDIVGKCWGSPSALGAEGRTFESCHPDHLKSLTYRSQSGSQAKQSLRCGTTGNANLRQHTPIEVGNSGELSQAHLHKDRKQYLRAYQNTWLKNRRKEWLEANGPCRQCGSSERLEVDHIDPSQKVSHRVWSLSQEKREAELKKCQPLCHGCHARKTSAYIYARRAGKPGKPQKLNEALVLEIYGLKKSGEGVRAIGRRFCICHSTVLKIWDGRHWGWLTQGDGQLSLLAKGAA